MFLLDTNVISEIAKNPAGLAAQRFAEEPREVLCTSIVVSAEVLFGLENSGVGARTRAAMLAVLDSLQIVGLEPPVDKAYASLRSALAKAGRSITPNDIWIAAHAQVLGATVVTGDRALLTVPGITVENWLRP